MEGPGCPCVASWARNGSMVGREGQARSWDNQSWIGQTNMEGSMEMTISTPESRRRHYVDRCIANFRGSSGLGHKNPKQHELWRLVAEAGRDATMEQINAAHAAVGLPPGTGIATTWCWGCDREVEFLVQVGEDVEYESQSYNLCPDCLAAAVAMIDAARGASK